MQGWEEISQSCEASVLPLSLAASPQRCVESVPTKACYKAKKYAACESAGLLSARLEAVSGWLQRLHVQVTEHLPA